MAVHLEARLNLGFELFEVIVKTPGRDAAKFTINAVEIGENDKPQREGEHTKRIDENRHGLCQSQRAPETLLATVHFAAVGLVVVTHQMKNPVQDEDVHLPDQRPTEGARVPAGNRRRNSDIAKIGTGVRGEIRTTSNAYPSAFPSANGPICREGQYIRRTTFATVGAIPTGDLGICDQTYGQSIGRKAEHSARAYEKFLKVLN
jgi:hypothetical protein